MTLFSPAVTESHSSFQFHYRQSFACISAGNKFPPETNTDGQIQYSPALPSQTSHWCPLTVTQRQQSRAGCRRERCDEPPRVHIINYPDITSPVAEDSAGKGQPSGSHKDQFAMHVTAPAGPASALPTSHFRDMTNASTRLLIAPKMPQQCLLMLT